MSRPRSRSSDDSVEVEDHMWRKQDWKDPFLERDVDNNLVFFALKVTSQSCPHYNTFSKSLSSATLTSSSIE